MTLILRPAAQRGHAHHGWLESHHSFSFAHYYDPAHMGFRSLRVINEDVIRGGSGFPMHGHRDMEIITYVLTGAVTHRDSTGAFGITQAGDIQVMTAGSGIRHSEFNASATDDLHLLQIWIHPDTDDLSPGYRQISIPAPDKLNRLCLLVAPEVHPGTLSINQDARLYAAVLEADRTLEHRVEKGRGVWVQVVRGRIRLNGHVLKAGDGAEVENEDLLRIEAQSEAEFLLFDLA